MVAVSAIVFPNSHSEWHRIIHNKYAGSPVAQNAKFQVQLVIASGRIDVIPSWAEDAPGSEGDLWSRAASGKIAFVTASYFVPGPDRRGLLGLTEEVVVRKLVFDEELSDEQARAATEAVLVRLEQEAEGSDYRLWAAELREFDRLYGGTQIRILPWGYVWNVIVLLAATIGVIGGIDAVLHGPGRVRAYRRQRLAKQGRCPRCGYSMAGIGGACPECGEPQYEA
jgi:hypothetical protein